MWNPNGACIVQSIAIPRICSDAASPPHGAMSVVSDSETYTQCPTRPTLICGHSLRIEIGIPLINFVTFVMGLLDDVWQFRPMMLCGANDWGLGAKLGVVRTSPA